MLANVNGAPLHRKILALFADARDTYRQSQKHSFAAPLVFIMSEIQSRTRLESGCARCVAKIVCQADTNAGQIAKPLTTKQIVMEV